MAEMRLIDVKKEILSDNQARAAENRELLRRNRVFMVNLMASPGAGKTSLIMRTISELREAFGIGVIEGDIASAVDAEKVAAAGVPAVQLRTGGFCHLDATMISMALQELELAKLDLVIVENVGNLVCPAEFDLGENKKAMILSIPEGDDKPLKYPLMFSVTDVLVINKMDYLGGGNADFDMTAFMARIQSLNQTVRTFKVSCKTGEGLGSWTHWLRDEITLCRGAVPETIQ